MIPLIDDDVEEQVEQFLGRLTTSESSDVVLLNPATATIQITDDDSKIMILAVEWMSLYPSTDVMFSFRDDAYTFNESSGMVTIYVDKMGNTDRMVMLMVSGRKYYYQQYNNYS